MGDWCPSGWKRFLFPFHYEISNWSGKRSKALIDLQGWFLLLPIENYIFLTAFGRSKHKKMNITILYVKNYIYKKLKEAVEIRKNQTKNHSVSAKIYKVYIICTPKCDAFGNSFFPLLNIMECYNQTDDECSIFFTLHCTIRASFSHHLVIW